MADELNRNDSEEQQELGLTVEIEEAAADGKLEEPSEMAVSNEPQPTVVKPSRPKRSKSKKEEPAVVEASTTEEEAVHLEWYILKVQSNREDSITKSLERRARIAGLERFFGRMIVPTETVTEMKGGRRKVTKQKLYPGYVVIEMEINQDTWYLVRQTSGVGDFAGSRDQDNRPLPMLPAEVEKILALSEEKTTEETPTLKISFKVGDRVKVVEGNFESYEGNVHSIDTTSGRVTVLINIFGRSTQVELEYWQIESL